MIEQDIESDIEEHREVTESADRRRVFLDHPDFADVALADFGKRIVVSMRIFDDGDDNFVRFVFHDEDNRKKKAEETYESELEALQNYDYRDSVRIV